MSVNPFYELARKNAVQFIEEHDPQYRELSSAELKEAYKNRSFSAGWRVRVVPGEDERLVDVLVTQFAPFDHPEIGIAALNEDERPQFGGIVGGTLCINLEGNPWPVLTDATPIRLALERAKAALEQWKDIPDEDVRSVEIASYWASSKIGPTIYSMLDVAGKTRRVYVATDNRDRSYVADDEGTLVTFLDRINKDNSGRSEGLLLDIHSLPKSITTAARLLHRVCEKGTDVDLASLLDAARIPHRDIPIILRVPTRNGPVLLGAWLRRTLHGDSYNVLDPDARVGEVTRFFDEELTFERADVQRIDAEWLFTRGAGVELPALMSKHVVVIGAGSLGSALASRLAKAGMGKITLIDFDVLTWDNILRHYLGATWVGYKKASALGVELRSNLPHIDVSWHTLHWENVWAFSPETFISADLVVSTIADWPSEAMLNAIARTTPGFPDVLYAWLEDRAAAAHALHVSTQGGCLACGMSPIGEFSERVVCFKEPTLQRIPGCAGFFQPYAAAEADAAAAIVVETVIDILSNGTKESSLTTWIGGKRLLEQYDGTIRPQWIALHGDPGDGRIQLRRKWDINPSCPFCGNAE